MTLFDAHGDGDTDAGGPTFATSAAEVDGAVRNVQRIRMTVAYDGAPFHGFAAQPGVVTVAGSLVEALGRVLRTPSIELTCAGRTDAGVHARGQVVSFDVATNLVEGPDALDRIQRAVNRLCGPQIVVGSIAFASAEFDARFSARSRLYRYTVVNRPWPDPFLDRTAWHVATPLDLRTMTLACDPFIGEHDFSSFCRRPKTSPGAEAASLTRRVLGARWEEVDDGVLHFWIEATAFCHQMVRSITGTMVDVGRGRTRAGDVLGILRARDRHAAGDLAPPQGLCLWSVQY